MAQHTNQTLEISDNILKSYKPLRTASDLDPLLERIGDARFVLLGEASHGTHEYYTWRTAISKRLIEEKGFSLIAVEGDWPDCYKINRWVKSYEDAGEKIPEVLRSFKRWPTWMWANWEVAALAEWLRNHNEHLAPDKKVGFYGLDVYSLWESMDLVINYLDREDPEVAKLARRAVNCFEPYDEEERAYIRALDKSPEGCREEVLRLLREVREKAPAYDGDREAGLNAEVNALVMANAEKYYRSMVTFADDSWNVRDQHMVETLNTLMKFHGDDAKVIIWEHNTHIGDARATDMASQGLFNVGQLVRERHKKEDVVLVGFGSYQGEVMAGSAWGAPMQKMPLPEARFNSVEEILHRDAPEDKLLIFDQGREISDFFDQWLRHRAIGVVYHPDRERGNYVPTRLSARYDAFLFIDQTKALHPVYNQPESGIVPDTYPFGL